MPKLHFNAPQLRDELLSVIENYRSNVNPDSNVEFIWTYHGHRGRDRADSLRDSLLGQIFILDMVHEVSKLPWCTLQKHLDAKLKSIFSVADSALTFNRLSTPMGMFGVSPEIYHHSSRENLYRECEKVAIAAGQNGSYNTVSIRDTSEDMPSPGPASKM